jgi:hypothetical protein
LSSLILCKYRNFWFVNAIVNQSKKQTHQNLWRKKKISLHFIPFYARGTITTYGMFDGWLFVVYIATFNNIPVISWRSILFVEETGVPKENQRPVASHWQTCLKINGLKCKDIFFFRQRFWCVCFLEIVPRAYLLSKHLSNWTEQAPAQVYLLNFFVF